MSGIEHMDAFRLLYEENVSSMTMFARRFVEPGAAADIVHDVFLEILRKWDSPALPSRSYLMTAVRNRCVNAIRREGVKDNYKNNVSIGIKERGLDYYDTADRFLLETEGTAVIRGLLDILPTKCREVFTMAYFDDKANSEIAAELGISVRTVEHHLYLGLKTLRETLQQRKDDAAKRPGSGKIYSLLLFALLVFETHATV